MFYLITCKKLIIINYLNFSMPHWFEDFELRFLVKECEMTHKKRHGFAVWGYVFLNTDLAMGKKGRIQSF